MSFVRGLFTDAKDRPEIKVLLGAPIIVAAVAYGIATRDWAGFGALAALGGGLLGVTTVADARTDEKGEPCARERLGG